VGLSWGWKLRLQGVPIGSKGCRSASFVLLSYIYYIL
jgi:hypothetical protein